jgi:hypothetical protein
MPTLTLGGVKYDFPSREEIAADTHTAVRHGLEQWRSERAKKRLEETVPFNVPAASAFIGPFGSPLPGYVWSLKLVAVNLSAPGTLAVYKASSSGVTTRPLAALPVTIPPVYTTQTAPAVPATTVAAQNTTNQAYTVVISGGSGLSAVTVNGVIVGSGDGTYTVPPYGAISVTYSTTAPTWTWTATQTSPPAAPAVQVATWSADQARLKMSEGVYLVTSATITQAYVTAWQVPAEMEADVYD